MQSFALRSNLRNALYLAVPKQECGEKFPAKSVTLSIQSTSIDSAERKRLRTVLPGTPDFVSCSPAHGGVQFGAFREDFHTRAEQVRAHVMSYAQELRALPISEAAERWLEQKSMYNRDSTIECYRDYVKRLIVFFEPVDENGNPLPRIVNTLDELHIGHLVSYQGRMKKQYHAASVNHDLNTLSQIMKKAGLWTAEIQEHYKPLPLPEADPIKVMSEGEEDRFFEFASKNPEWWLAYWVASLTNNSTASGKELRMLRLEAIHMATEPPTFHVPKNMKTPQRQRTIPLNERGATIMERLINRAHSLGSTRPEHYLFPFRVRRNLFDPTRPASESWIKYRWKMLVDAALEAKVISFRIKPHNLRHQAMTKLLDYGVPIEVVRQIAGHGVDSLVTRHYHHGRLETMANALSTIDPDKKRPISTNGNSKGEKNAG